jgi:hypothetical protein
LQERSFSRKMKRLKKEEGGPQDPPLDVRGLIIGELATANQSGYSWRVPFLRWNLTYTSTIRVLTTSTIARA